MKNNISKSQKLATISFNFPDDAWISIQETKDHPSIHLRTCIKIAYDAFMDAYDKKGPKG